MDGTIAAETLRSKMAYVHNSRTFAIKGKVVSVHDIRPIGRGGGTSPPILNIGTGWRLVVSIIFRPFYPCEKKLW